jgi:hypothetical protein
VKISTGILIRLDFISFALSEKAAGQVKESRRRERERKKERVLQGLHGGQMKNCLLLIQHSSWHCARFD